MAIHLTQPTMNILQQYLFSWSIWPNFTRIPDSKNPYLRYEIISLGEAVDLGGRNITSLPANHVVPAVGFQLDSGNTSLVFIGDTGTNGALWTIVNKIDNLRYLIIESAFCNQKRDIAIRSKHLCPSLLAAELEKLERHAQIYILPIWSKVKPC